MELNWIKIKEDKSNLPKEGEKVLVFIEATENSSVGYWNDIRLDRIKKRKNKLYWENFLNLEGYSVTYYAYIKPPKK